MLCVQGSPLYQWDVNRQLKIDSVDTHTNFTVHCCHKDDKNALVVEPIIEGESILVNIPNILLQKYGFISVYVVIEGDTIYDTTFYIMARPKPDDYVYTETEVLSYVELEKRVSRIEENGGAGGGDGATFIPTVSPEGVISWTNDKGLNNPDPVNLVEAVISALPNGDEVSY